MPPKKQETKTTTRKTPARKTTTAKKSTPTKTVATNTRHIDENTREIQNNTKLIYILFGVIIFLAVLLAALAFYIGTMYGKNNENTNGWPVVPSSQEDIVVTVIDDSRCNDCQTDEIMEQLKAQPFLANAQFEKKDFSDAGVEKMMQENNLENIPTVLFNTNILNDGGQIAAYLKSIRSGEFSLALPQIFNPFEKRSENGFLTVEPSVIDAIKADAHYEWNENAKITWIEYTDVNCHYCKQMEQDGTAKKVLEKFPEILSKTSSNFIGVGGAASQKAAELLECAAVDWGAEMYNSLLSSVLLSGDNSEETMLTYITENGGNKDEVKACLDNGDMKEMVARKFARGQTDFGISGTPGNVILNNETGEYEVISGAYPVEKFIEVIEKMNK